MWIEQGAGIETLRFETLQQTPVPLFLAQQTEIYVQVALKSTIEQRRCVTHCQTDTRDLEPVLGLEANAEWPNTGLTGTYFGMGLKTARNEM